MPVSKVNIIHDIKNLEDSVGEIGFFESVKEEFGLRQLRFSCIADKNTEMLFRSFLKGKNIGICFEIGTFFGTSTAILAHYSDKVVTIDKDFFYEPCRLWCDCGVLPKIDYYILGNDEDKKTLIDKLKFDFAFVDGCHREGVELDFALVKKCGRVLFHDYYSDYKKMPALMLDNGLGPTLHVKKLVDSLPKEEVTIIQPFAYWERNGSNKR